MRNESMRAVASAVLAAHPNASVMTIDFFDTLVTRAVAQPTHVFAEMERRLVAGRGVAWRGFARVRVEAEHAARRAAAVTDEHRDITLEEIHREVAAAMGLSFAQRCDLAALERDVEIELARPVPFGAAIVELARERGMRVAIVSDNYMPADHLVNMAVAAGLTGFDRGDVFVSCEHGGQKSNGRIWVDVLDRLGVEPSQVVHVGDDPVSDGERPRSLGMASHVRATMRASHRHMINTAPAVLPLSRLEASMRDDMDADATDANHSDAGGWDPAAALGGGLVALIVAAQIADVMSVLAVRDVAGIHFVARDGHLAHTVWNRLRESGRDLPPATYTAFSRSVIWRATLTECTPESVRRFVGDDETLTLQRLERRVGCPLVAEVDPTEPIDAVIARGIIVANGDRVVAEMKAHRQRMLGYLGTQGVLDPGHHVVVDLGWTGSSVAALADMVGVHTDGAVTMEGRFTGLYWDATPHRRRLAMHACAMDEFGGLSSNLRLLGALNLVETLVAAPHGSVVGYRSSEENYAPVLVESPVEVDAWSRVVGRVADSAVVAAERILDGTHPSGVTVADLDGSAVWAAIMQVAHTPRPDEVELMSAVSHVTSIDHEGDGRPLIADASFGRVLSGSDELVEWYDSLIHHHWMQGTLASWESRPSKRWLADEIRRTWPTTGHDWMSPR